MSPLRDLLHRLTAELLAAPAMSSDPLLDGSVIAAQPREQPGRRSSRPINVREDDAEPAAPMIDWPAAIAHAETADSDRDANDLSAEPTDFGSLVHAIDEGSATDRVGLLAESFERRVQQLERDSTQALEQLAELFRRAFASKEELASLATRLRDLESAHILRGRL